MTITNIVLFSFLIAAIIFNLFFSGRNRIEIEGYEAVNIKFEHYAAQCAPECRCELEKAFEYADNAGYDRMCVIKKLIMDRPDKFESAFVFINKNFSIYLEIYINGGLIKNIDLISQFYDSKIFVTTDDADKKAVDSRWITVEYFKAGKYYRVENKSDYHYELAIKLKSMTEKHIKILTENHKAPAVSPYYATAQGYASCRNYINDIMKLDLMK